MKIINIATFPLPMGGVSCFLKRLKAYTDEINGKEDYEYVDVSGLEMGRKSEEGIKAIKKSSIFKYLMKEKPAYIVFHSNSVGHLILNIIFMQKHKFIYFTHGESILKKKNRKGWRHWIINKAEYIITPTYELLNEVKEIFPLKKEIKNIPFILFPKNVTPLEDKRIIVLKEKVTFIFSAYANSLTKFHGENLYGIDLMIELIYQLRNAGNDVGLVLLITTIDDRELFEEYKQRIRCYGLEDYIVILNEVIDEASKLYISSDAYLRPTNTDGDSFSIWEALYLGIPVIASDATQRPKGCILFKNRSIEDLIEKAEWLIQNYETVKKETKSLDIVGSEKQLISFFANILGK